MGLDARLGVRRGEFHLDVSLSIAEGEVLAVLGPNGAGKSTILTAVAGLLAVDDGCIVIDTTVVDDAEHQIFVAPEHRNVGVVFQGAPLFDSLSVIENVAFGPRARGARRAAARSVATDWLRKFDLLALTDRRPAELSGGQAQRVALARALATDPALLLLDEPTAALDIRAKAEVRRDLLRLQRERPVTTLLITHDPLDAFALADRIAVLENGRVAQSGTLDEVAAHPRSRHIADMIGISLVRGDVTDGVLTTATGATVVVPADTPPGPSIVSIRPASVSLHRTEPEGSARNCWPMTVIDLDRHPDRIHVRLDGPLPLLAELTPSGAAALALTPGDHIWSSVKASEVSVLPDLAP